MPVRKLQLTASIEFGWLARGQRCPRAARLAEMGTGAFAIEAVQPPGSGRPQTDFLGRLCPRPLGFLAALLQVKLDGFLRVRWPLCFANESSWNFGPPCPGRPSSSNAMAFASPVVVPARKIGIVATIIHKPTAINLAHFIPIVVNYCFHILSFGHHTPNIGLHYYQFGSFVNTSSLLFYSLTKIQHNQITKKYGTFITYQK